MTASNRLLAFRKGWNHGGGQLQICRGWPREIEILTGRKLVGVRLAPGGDSEVQFDVESAHACGAIPQKRDTFQQFHEFFQ